MPFFKPLCTGALLVAALLSTGCTHTHPVSRDDAATPTFSDVHRAVEGRRIDVALRDGRTIPSTALLIQPDTTYTIDLLTRRLRSEATGDIQSVTYTQTGKGIVEGAVIGGLGGALAGLAAGVALTSYRDPDVAETGVLQYVGVVMGVGALVGASTGSLVGWSRGSKDLYVYPQLSRNADAPALPVRSTQAGGR